MVTARARPDNFETPNTPTNDLFPSSSRTSSPCRPAPPPRGGPGFARPARMQSRPARLRSERLKSQY
eukprot:26762-Heterocapsa_arctica.AAC.1